MRNAVYVLDPARHVTGLRDHGAQAVVGGVVDHEGRLFQEIGAVFLQDRTKILHVTIEARLVETHASDDESVVSRRTIDGETRAVGAAMDLRIHKLDQIVTDPTERAENSPRNPTHSLSSLRPSVYCIQYP